MGNAQEKANDMAYSAVALLAFFAAFHNADGVLGGDSMATAEQNLGATLVDEPMMMAPEPEFDLATSRSRVNQDPATLTRPELRYGNYLPLLGRGRRLLDSEEANGGNTLLAPAPAEDEEGTLELATERGRLGGRTGMNFGTGTLYTQNRFDNRRHLLEAHDDHDDHDDHDHDHDHEAEAEPAAAVVDDEMASMMMMAPEPEMDLATSRARLAFAPGRSFDAKDSPALLAALGNVGRRRQLLGEEMESEMMMMAPEPEFDLATSRARLAFAPGRSFDAKDSPALLAALGNVGRR